MDQPFLLDTIIADAYLKGVSDIHLESLAGSGRGRVFFRIKGVMREYMTIPESVSDAILKRIKSMANLNVENRLAKIGCIIFRHNGLPEFSIMVTLRPNDGQREVATLRIQNT